MEVLPFESEGFESGGEILCGGAPSWGSDRIANEITSDLLAKKKGSGTAERAALFILKKQRIVNIMKMTISSWCKSLSDQTQAFSLWLDSL